MSSALLWKTIYMTNAYCHKTIRYAFIIELDSLKEEAVIRLNFQTIFFFSAFTFMGLIEYTLLVLELLEMCVIHTLPFSMPRTIFVSAFICCISFLFSMVPIMLRHMKMMVLCFNKLLSIEKTLANRTHYNVIQYSLSRLLWQGKALNSIKIST